MVFRIGNEGFSQIKKDLSKKFLSGGMRLGGRTKGDKVELYLEDEHGKHSSFVTRTFYGRFDGEKLVGNFRINTYVLVLLGVLLGVAIESLIMNIINSAGFSIIFTAAVIIAEIIYFSCIAGISKTHDRIVKQYLVKLSSEGEQVGY